MKKYIIFILIILFIPIISVNALTDKQKAVLEVAKAYYNRTNYIQYDTYRSFYFTPEEAIYGNSQYFVCSSFVAAVYENALGITIPKGTGELVNAASGETEGFTSNEILRYYDTFTGISTYADIYSNFLSDIGLQVGDLIIWRQGGAGHVVMIASGKQTINGTNNNYYIYHSNGGGLEAGYGKIQLNYNSMNGNGLPGTVKYYNLADEIASFAGASKKQKLSIVRPINRTGNYPITASAQTRLDYPDIKIMKMIDNDKEINNDSTLTNNSIINLGEKVYYRITITNGSDSAYGSLVVTENVSPYLANLSTNPATTGSSISGSLSNRVITWNISSIGAGETITLAYSGFVTSDYNLLNEKIISTGFVGNIPNATITNYIGKNYGSSSISSLINTYNNKKNTSSNTGIAFINEIYNNATVYNKINLSNITITYDNNCSTYISGDTSKKCIKISDNNNADDYLFINDLSSVHVSRLPLNNNNYLAPYILTNYYGGTRDTVNSNNEPLYSLKYFKEDDTDISRMDTIYKENFKTGDILIYETNDTVTGESGTYAFIYIDDGVNPKGFYGKNADGKNFYPADETTTNGNNLLNMLLVKDAYVILRPTAILPNISSSNNLVITQKNNKTYALFKPTSTNTTLDLRNLVDAGIYSTRVTNNGSSDSLSNSSNVRTTDRLKVTFENGEDEYEYIVSVLGDVYANGTIDKLDAERIATRIIDNNFNALNYELQVAADYNMDGKYKMNDVMKLINDYNINISN